MAPSEEAMAAAEKLVRMEVAHETPDCTLVVAGVELYSVNASQGYMSEMYDTVCELQAGIATALDAHTADLRREVEALRARVAWKRVGDELPPMDEKVMCYTSNGFFVPMMRVEREGYWVWVDDTDGGWFESRVTHWQPLPDKPSE